MKSNFAFALLNPTLFIQHDKFKMEDLVSVIILNELVDSDDEKPTRGKTRQWIKRRNEKRYFTNII